MKTTPNNDRKQFPDPELLDKIVNNKNIVEGVRKLLNRFIVERAFSMEEKP